MGLKDNFKQAARELMDTPGAGTGVSAEPVSEPEYQSSPSPLRTEPVVTRAEPARQPTFIAAGTVIHGSIETEGDLELYGEVQGNITGKEDLKLRGKLTGNATGKNIEMSGMKMEGNLTASGMAHVDEGSILIGNLQAEELTLNGRIKGDVVVRQRLAMQNQAVIAGRVTAGKLSVAEGAILQGEIRIAQANTDKLFNDTDGRKN